MLHRFSFNEPDGLVENFAMKIARARSRHDAVYPVPLPALQEVKQQHGPVGPRTVPRFMFERVVED